MLLTGVKIPRARVCFQMQFSPTAAASLGAVAAGCLGQAVAWDICQCNVNDVQYLSTDAITLRKGKWHFWCGWFFWVFFCIHLSGSICDW